MKLRLQKQLPERRSQASFRKWLKVCLIIVGALSILLFAGWVGFSNYVKRHKQALLTDITAKISTHLSGKLEIKDMEPALLKSFPNISVRLDSVTLVDSLYPEHHIKTLSLQSIFVRINVLSLLTNHPKIERITLSRGVFHLFTLNDGYSNSYLFSGEGDEGSSSSPNGKVAVHRLDVDHVTFIASQAPHNKLFKIDCNKVALKVKERHNLIDIQANMKVFVHQLGFNLNKGGYLKNRPVAADIRIKFDRKEKTLSLKQQRLKVAGMPIDISAVFDFGAAPASLQMDINAPVLDYATGISLLPQYVSKKLDIIAVKKPVAANISLKGGLQYPDTPVVQVRVQIENNSIQTPYGDFVHANMAARFTNHIHEGKGKGDSNSGIFIQQLKGDWMDIPVHADSITIDNLMHPLVSIRKLTGDFPAARLNKILGRSFAVTKGNTKLQLSYQGPVVATDTYPRRLNGYILLRHTDLTYLPRALKFTNCNAALVFQGSDLLIKTMSLRLGRSSIQIRGTGEDFLNAYFSGQEKAFFDCQLESPEVNLNDFKPLLAPRKKYSSFSAATKNNRINRFNKNMDELLDKSTMLLHMDIRKIDFNQFTAGQLHAGLQIEEDGITLNKVRLQHAGGSVAFDAVIHQQPDKNPFSLTASLQGLKIDRLFYAFNNFGQETLKSTNLQGRLSSSLNLKGVLSKDASIVPLSMSGDVRFEIKDGALNNFPPFVNISKFIFKGRHLEKVTFQTLSGHLTIDSGKINIPPMEINSSAINMTVQGVYAFHEGTDISMKIPLRNPQKIKKRIAQGLPPQKDKGVVVYLRARDGKDGKVHIGWDPLQKLRLSDTTREQ